MTIIQKLLSSSLLVSTLVFPSGTAWAHGNDSGGNAESGGFYQHVPRISPDMLDRAKDLIGLGAEATLVSIAADSTGGGTLQVTLSEDVSVTDNDGNITLDDETGATITVHYDENTVFVRRFFGKADSSELMAGDKLILALSIMNNNDSAVQSYHADYIMDTSIWRKGVSRTVVRVESIDIAANTITVSRASVWMGEVTQQKMATITYDEDTLFVSGNDKKGEATNAQESDIAVGENIRVQGTARLKDGEVVISHVDKIWVDASADTSAGSNED